MEGEVFCLHLPTLSHPMAKKFINNHTIGCKLLWVSQKYGQIREFLPFKTRKWGQLVRKLMKLFLAKRDAVGRKSRTLGFR
jgi:1,4-alpha-glucan branching enzyme